MESGELEKQGHNNPPFNCKPRTEKQSRNPPLVLIHRDMCLLRERHDKGFVATASPHPRAKPLRGVNQGA